MTRERLYTESEVLNAISAYRNLERTAALLLVGDESLKRYAAKSILETAVAGTIPAFVNEDIRKKVDITQVIYDAKGVLGLERSAEEAALKK